jgi:hypothetical protein
MKQLNEFWKMKSIMLKARRDPRVLDDPEYLQKARDYYEANSTLTQQDFWSHMTEATKMKTIRHLILQEVSEPQHLRMVSTKDKAAIYIVLSGTVEVQTDPSQEGVILGLFIVVILSYYCGLFI